MKKNTIILISVVAILVIAFLWGMSRYNGLVSSQENVNSQWANVESQYQRRSDLIPNLVSTVKGYAAHESSTLEGVVEAAREIQNFHLEGMLLTDGDRGPAGTTCCGLSAGNQFKGHAPDKWFCNQSKPTRVLASVTVPCMAQVAS